MCCVVVVVVLSVSAGTSECHKGRSQVENRTSDTTPAIRSAGFIPVLFSCLVADKHFFSTGTNNLLGTLL